MDVLVEAVDFRDLLEENRKLLNYFVQWWGQELNSLRKRKCKTIKIIKKAICYHTCIIEAAPYSTVTASLNWLYSMHSQLHLEHRS